MKTRFLIVIVLGITALSIFSISSSLIYDDYKTQEKTLHTPTSEFKEMQWNWHGPTSFLLGEKISFSVSRMDKFCDDVFTAKIVNLDRSKTFWQEPSKVNCSEFKGGNISQADFPVDIPIEIDVAGTYFVIVDYADFHGYPMLTKKIIIKASEDQ